jgi:glycosyltransferase involved in cell wall biosynthesis
MNSTISVVITCFREGKLIYEAIESIKTQTVTPLEILIVNDASPDPETNQICRQLEQDPFITVIWKQKNGGPSVARNDGIEASSGEIIVPLDADDILPQKALELIGNTFQNHPDAGFVYGNYYRQDTLETAGITVIVGEVSLSSSLKARKFSLSTDWKLLGTTPIRRSLWQKIDRYDVAFGSEDLHDVEFWIRVLVSGCSFYYIPETTYVWRKYLGTNSRKITPISWARIARKYFSIYQDLRLSYRAYELLLFDSKWSGDREGITEYSRQLKQCILSGNFQFSSIVIWLIPASVLSFLTRYALKSR